MLFHAVIRLTGSCANNSGPEIFCNIEVRQEGFTSG